MKYEERHHMHKNRLQEYTQRSGLSLPSYSTFNEGESHAPKFWATVFLNIHKDPKFCKLILNEYGAKLKKVRPTYTTIQQDELPPIFITTITFDGKTYVGFAGRNKKEAEQNAACVVIDSILVNSNTVAAMTQIIKKKYKLYETVKNIANAGNATLTSEIKGDHADGVIEGIGLMDVAPIVVILVIILPPGSLPTGPTSWIPFTSQLVDNFQSNQMNYHIPSSGLPMVVVDSQAIVPKEKKKKLKKRNAQWPSNAALGISFQPDRPCGRYEGHHMHKNRLQEYTQRSELSLPSYSTFNEGEPHAPKFWATVLLDEMKFTSPYIFSHRKEAE
ncbi:hypothetical protein IEQ34_022013 [Dendrobium chrysotoxum]|uniref:DRBM domain-containing protein n=1 Tax=Dendrobium chrysotoxum TaxID=161865 RepID=A0AAV7FXL9_DENCH|nr:hypothetical protein IEQ34_022013 [Dendrobium chrysotoxum]